MPKNLEVVDLRSRFFPVSWKDAAIRVLYDTAIGGVLCTGCGSILRSRAELRTLHSDHIIPWSTGGLTIWENLHLLCGACNLSKGDNLSTIGRGRCCWSFS